jgi:hypothetical protein
MAKVVEFIQEVIFRFGTPNNIITYMGSNFISVEFFNFCEKSASSSSMLW